MAKGPKILVMNKRNKIIVLSIVASLGIIISIGVFYIKQKKRHISYIINEQKKKYHKNSENLKQLKIGMGVDSVISIMGKPDFIVPDSFSSKHSFTQFSYGIEYIEFMDIKDARVLFDTTMHVVEVRIP